MDWDNNGWSVGAWWKSAACAVYVDLGLEMVRIGIAASDVLDMLGRAYTAATEEYGE